MKKSFLLFGEGIKMKKLVVASMFSVFLLGFMSNASAFWGSDKNWECYGPYGKVPGCNPYDEWDPRYWMEEMEDMFRWMYDNIDLWGSTDEQRDAAIIVIRNGLVNHAMVADPEINLSATLCELTQL